MLAPASLCVLQLKGAAEALLERFVVAAVDTCKEGSVRRGSSSCLSHGMSVAGCMHASHACLVHTLACCRCNCDALTCSQDMLMPSAASFSATLLLR